MTSDEASRLSSEQLAQALRLVRGADSVELKVSVPDVDRRSAIAALEMDPLEAQMRQVVFFDTPDLTLNQHGVVVRARRIQRKSGDSVIKLRPLDPERIPDATRNVPGFSVEVDAMPGGFVCSGSLKAAAGDSIIKDVVAGRSPVRKLFSKDQRALYAAHAPAGVKLDELAVLGPIAVHKLKFAPADYGRRLVAELWTYPDGSRILELSTKCSIDEAFQVAAETRAYLSGRGINMLAEQQTKTQTALRFFAEELAASGPGSGAAAS
ncbi:adenylate cyclase [Mumia zhuanghuii]|uniref:Adenylate cyclase n=2 Tax=Mumia TaxID=1546255 RepID=A0ABW1QPH9_9ACTN|nr:MULTISPECIES: adenylate cyclase [Mumia]KAA1425023.1 adenylate cyclase [Mumia zhuanghuii]